jgi:hypothetical protein
MTARRRLLLGAIALVALVVVPLGGIAYAYWTRTGSGTGSGQNGTTVAISLTPGTPTAALYPGGSTSVVLMATNTNTSPVRIDALQLDVARGTGGFAVDAGHSGCSVAALSFTTQNNGGNGWTVPARVGVTNGTLPITLTATSLAMSTTALSACQGATFTVYLVAA